MNYVMIYHSGMSKALFLIFLLFPAFTFAQKSLELDQTKAVHDLANVLSDQEEIRLNRKLDHYEDSTTNAFVVLTLSSLEPYTGNANYPIEKFAIEKAHEWGIGQEAQDNGILVLVVMDQKKVRIEVGYGLEGAIPDGLAGDVIRNYIRPAFKKDNYFQGLNEGTDVLIKLATGEYTAEDVKKEQEVNWGKVILFGIFFTLILIFIIFGRKDKYYEEYSGEGRRRGSIWPWIFLGGMGGSGGSWRGGSSGGGGFGGFGGGGFGGGGATGGW